MTQVLIDRELLERAVKADASRGASSIALVDGWKAMEQIRAILAQPTQQSEAVEVAQVVSYLSACADGYDPDAPHPGPPEPLMTVAQHNRILAARMPAGCKVVPVDLIERTICRLTHGHEHDKAVRELRALLVSAEGSLPGVAP